MDTVTEERPYACPHCPKRYRQPGTWRIHIKLHKEPATYQCPICEKTFSGGSTLKSHIMTHRGQKPHSCPECGRTFTQKANMQKHLGTHFNLRPWPCPQCERAFARKSHFQRHFQSVHDKIRKYPCSFCNMKFTSLDNSKKHEKSQHGPHHKKKKLIYRCYFCNITYASSEHFDRHSRLHTKEKPYRCPVSNCTSVFSGKPSRQFHLLRVHYKTEELKNLISLNKCYFCHHPHAEMSRLVAHMKKHTTEKPYNCGETGCRWSFGNHSHCLRHLRTVHSMTREMSIKKMALHTKILDAKRHEISSISCDEGKANKEDVVDTEFGQNIDINMNKDDPRIPTGSERILQRRYNCAFCGLISPTKREHIDHMNAQHDCSIPFKKRPAPSRRYRKKEPCYFCHKPLTLPSLNFHMTQHTKEVQEKCEGCGAKFRNMQNLRYHWQKSCTQISTKEPKKYPCKFCPKIFCVWKSLVSHLRRIHLGEVDNFVECFQCGQQFKTVQERDAHMQLVHMEDSKNWPCHVSSCGEKFFTKRLLNFHLGEAHPGVKRLGTQPNARINKCLICLMYFKQSKERMQTGRLAKD
ncbi:zinc finger protein 84 isoform X2 [Folsomia candida]|uniref:zinc finger protein 84 isoform X2 n=1 Tax=Folsomia candida TaxID=158441 RepID=UPI001604A3F2|nr:zinc finger protein 84 isoform X2 [Folsomia candida]XP_035714074.1 zinc finger protein 84 isoform X2 [Folsomia candida]